MKLGLSWVDRTRGIFGIGIVLSSFGFHVELGWIGFSLYWVKEAKLK